MKPLCILDLDGTLLDCSRRHYQCYLDIVTELDRRAWSYQDYWRMKREARSLSRILDSTDHELLKTYSERWLELIESPDKLRLDQPFPGVVDKLREWKGRGLLVLATMRRQRNAVREQLAELDMLGLFDQLIVVHGRDKAASVRDKLAFNFISLTWIGDTELDRQAGLAMGARVCLVSNGIRDAKHLRMLGSDKHVAVYPDMTAIDPFSIPWEDGEPPELTLMQCGLA